MAFIFFLLNMIGPSDSHFVVKFPSDETMCIIPRKSIVSPAIPSINNDCEIKWSDGELFRATVLAAGEYKLLAKSVMVQM